MKKIIKGAHVILSDRVESDISVLVSGNKIDGLISGKAEVSSDYEVMNAEGLYLSAGFVDIHQHGGGGVDYMDCEDDTYLLATEAHLAHGITSVMPTVASATEKELVRAVKGYKSALSDRRIRANLLGIHMEGPYLSPAQCGAMRPDRVHEPDEREYRALYELSEGNIRRWGAAPELCGADEFARFANENGIVLSIAHSNADFDTVIRAYDMGFHHVTHLYSATSTITRRSGFRVAGVLEAAYYIDGMNVELIADGCHLPDSLINYAMKFKSHDRIALITDAMRIAGTDAREGNLGSKDSPNPVIVEDGVAKLPDRSAFAGSVATGDRLIRTALSCGISLCEAVKMFTENPLLSMNLDVKKGRIEKGYDADLVLFDENINVKKVIVGGKTVL